MSDTSPIQRDSALRRWLAAAPPVVFSAWAMSAAFATYFCMYAFRKPFAAASFDGLTFGDTEVALKTAFVISQILGYTLSKYVGVKVCSEAGRERRMVLLLALIGAAELALLLFAVLPGSWKVVAIFANGLPLGMVWGLVVSYLEGRRTSELLLAGLSCSFIVASGMVKDVGRWLMRAFDVTEAWMPVTTGLLFLLPFAVSVWLLDQLPPPSADDEEERTARAAMNHDQRWAFVRRFAPGLVLLLLSYFFLTAFRDFRDNYGVELFAALGYGDEPAIFTRTEIPVALGVMFALATLTLIRDNRLGLLGAFGIMSGGTMLVGVATFALDRAWIDGAQWMVLIGLGSYLAYVPFGSVLFDRMIAYTRVTATAVFAIYLADALGYTGSVALQLYKDLGQAEVSYLSFFRACCYGMSIGGTALLVTAAAWFMRQRPTAARAASTSHLETPR